MDYILGLLRDTPTEMVHFLLRCTKEKGQNLDLIFRSPVGVYTPTGSISAANNPENLAITKPLFEPSPSTDALNPYWISGFVQADGSFGLPKGLCCGFINETRSNNSTTVSNLSTCSRFIIITSPPSGAERARIIKTLGCGNLVRPSGDRLVYGISVSNHKDLYNTIIPFFNLYLFLDPKLSIFKISLKVFQFSIQKAT
jgi:hypothetical protein